MIRPTMNAKAERRRRMELDAEEAEKAEANAKAVYARIHGDHLDAIRRNAPEDTVLLLAELANTAWHSWRAAMHAASHARLALDQE